MAEQRAAYKDRPAPQEIASCGEPTRPLPVLRGSVRRKRLATIAERMQLARRNLSVLLAVLGAPWNGARCGCWLCCAEVLEESVADGGRGVRRIRATTTCPSGRNHGRRG